MQINSKSFTCSATCVPLSAAERMTPAQSCKTNDSLLCKTTKTEKYAGTILKNKVQINCEHRTSREGTIQEREKLNRTRGASTGQQKYRQCTGLPLSLHTHTQTHSQTHTHTHTHIYIIHTHRHTRTFIYVRISTPICPRAHAHTYICMCICVCVSVYIYTHTHTHLHT